MTTPSGALAKLPRGKIAPNLQLSPPFLDNWCCGKCFNAAHQRRLIMIGFALNPV
jgi:hypothetical protein